MCEYNVRFQTYLTHKSDYYKYLLRKNRTGNLPAQLRLYVQKSGAKED